MNVEFRDAGNDTAIHQQDLPFDPRLSPEIELIYGGNVHGRIYEVVRDRGRMVLSADANQATLIVYLKRPNR